MRGSFANEIFKTAKRPATWILFGVFLTLTLFFGYFLPYAAYATGSDLGAAGGVPPEEILGGILPAELVPNLLGGFPLFGGAIALILAALSAGGEYGWGTLKTILTQRPRRLTVLGGKLLGIAVVVLALVLASFAFGAAASSVVAAVESRPMSWPSAADLAEGIAAGWLVLGMWSLFGAVLAVLSRSTALAVGLGLVWALVLENLFRGVASLLDVFETLQQVLPGTNAGSLVAALGAPPVGEPQGTPGVVAVVEGTQAAVVLGGYAVAFALVAAVALQRRDVA